MANGKPIAMKSQMGIAGTPHQGRGQRIPACQSPTRKNWRNRSRAPGNAKQRANVTATGSASRATLRVNSERLDDRSVIVCGETDRNCSGNDPRSTDMATFQLRITNPTAARDAIQGRRDVSKASRSVAPVTAPPRAASLHIPFS